MRARKQKIIAGPARRVIGVVADFLEGNLPEGAVPGYAGSGTAA